LARGLGPELGPEPDVAQPKAKATSQWEWLSTSEAKAIGHSGPVHGSGLAWPLMAGFGQLPAHNPRLGNHYSGDPEDDGLPADLRATERDEIGIIQVICVKVCKVSFATFPF
jgi:hypothetical protein